MMRLAMCCCAHTWRHVHVRMVHANAVWYTGRGHVQAASSTEPPSPPLGSGIRRPILGLGLCARLHALSHERKQHESLLVERQQCVRVPRLNDFLHLHSHAHRTIHTAHVRTPIVCVLQCPPTTAHHVKQLHTSSCFNLSMCDGKDSHGVTQACMHHSLCHHLRAPHMHSRPDSDLSHRRRLHLMWHPLRGHVSLLWHVTARCSDLVGIVRSHATCCRGCGASSSCTSPNTSTGTGTRSSISCSRGGTTNASC